MTSDTLVCFGTDCARDAIVSIPITLVQFNLIVAGITTTFSVDLFSLTGNSLPLEFGIVAALVTAGIGVLDHLILHFLSRLTGWIFETLGLDTLKYYD